MEEFANRGLRDAEAFHAWVVARAPADGEAILLVDEIQDIAGFEEVLRSLLNEGRWDLYVTGSNARMMSGELATLLAGRYVEIPVYSLDFEEFLLFHGREATEAAFMDYLRWGGLPQLAFLPDREDIRRDYLASILDSVFLKDVVARHAIRHVDFLRRLSEYVADTTGSLLSVKRIADFLKSQRFSLSPAVVSDYLSHLAAAFLVFRVPREDLAGRRILEVGEKWYFQDLGLKAALAGFDNRHLSGLVENAVFLHLKASGWELTLGQWGQREIDFVARRQGETLYVQTAYLIPDDAVRQREFGNLLALPDNHPKLVVSLDPLRADERGVRHLHLMDFLRRRW
jgi:predicted AAA+ superfamily ATPase